MATMIVAARSTLDLGTRVADAATCRCGHDRDAHQHFRPGSDCGACGSSGCGRFVDGRGGWLQRLLGAATAPTA